MSVDTGSDDDQASLASQTLGEGHLLFFANASSLSRVEDALKGDLTAHGFLVKKASDEVLYAFPTRQAVEAEATRAKLLKPVAPELSGNTAGAFERFDHEARALYDGVDSLDFFTGGEINRMAHRIMHYNIKVDADMQALLASLPHAAGTQVHEGDTCFPTLERLGLLESVTPVHAWDVGRKLDPAMISKFPSTDAIRDYYGEAVALYFAWMNYMWRWLCFPAVLGLVVHGLNAHLGTDVDVTKSPFAPFFSLVMILWGILYIKYWQRREAALALHWGTIWVDKHFKRRPGFWGTWRKSPVTGRQELYFASWRRLPRYALSIVVTTVLLAFAFFVMILNLNLQGYIQDKTDEFHVDWLARASAPGGIFDPAQGNSLLGLVPIFVTSGVIFCLNSGYRRVAEWLTDYENHTSPDRHRASLVIKRFLFEAFASYIALFYLAFWQLDAHKVRQELQSLFMADCLRRLVTEVVFPWVLQRASLVARRTEVDKLLKDNKGKAPRSQVVADMLKDDYDDFDDYIEMAIQFGYVTMFAGAMPTAATVACLYTVVEMYSDLYKLVYLTKRPQVERAQSIGVWAGVLQVQAWLAILTNCLVFGFSSDQVVIFAPQLFRRKWFSLEDEMVLSAGSGRYLVGTIMVLEHVMVLVCMLIWFCIPGEPLHVREARARRRYLEGAQAEDAKHSQRLRALNTGVRLQGSF